jgi:integrase/recombinase XerD
MTMSPFSIDMRELFERFLREKTYLVNLSPKTALSYRQAFKHFQGHSLTKQGVTEFVVGMREAGLSPGACNVYIRSINSFLSWCHEQGHEHLKIKQLKEETKTIHAFSDKELRAIINFRPTTFGEKRLHTLLLLLIDTGIRINEALTLELANVDFDNLLITVTGKGNKQRTIPISHEARKVLFRFTLKNSHRFVFSTRHGDLINYHNIRRDYAALAKKIGIGSSSFHALRHNYGLSHIRNGGDVFSLQRILGHSDLSVTKRYVNMQTEDLSHVHRKTSILSRLR